MSQSNAIGRTEERIQTHEAKIETLNKKRVILLEKIKNLGRSDMSTSALLAEQVRMIEADRNDLMTKIKTLRTNCRRADNIETMVTDQQHLDDLNLFMVQSMNTVGITRVKGINTASEKIAEDAKLFSLYTSPDPDQEEKESEESRRYLEELLGGLEESSSSPQNNNNKVTSQQPTVGQQQKQIALSDLDNFMARLK